MAKRKDAMALFEAISKTQAKPGGQVLPPHVGIQPQPVKAESRAVLYVPPTEGGETAEPGSAPPPPPSGGARGTFSPAARPLVPPERTGLYVPVQNSASGGQVAVPGMTVAEFVPAAEVIPSAEVVPAGRPPESSVTPVVAGAAKTSATTRPASPISSAPVARAAASAPPVARDDSSSWSRPRVVALILAAILVVGAVWFLTVKPKGGPEAPVGDATQAGLGATGQSEELPTPPQEFRAGSWYLLVEDTGSNEQAAVHIADWLTQRNVPAAAVFNPKNSRWGVMARQPFDDVPYRVVNGKTEYNAEASELAKTVESMGKVYFSQYRTYKFLQTNPAGEFTPRYVPIK